MQYSQAYVDNLWALIETKRSELRTLHDRNAALRNSVEKLAVLTSVQRSADSASFKFTVNVDECVILMHAGMPEKGIRMIQERLGTALRAFFAGNRAI